MDSEMPLSRRVFLKAGAAAFLSGALLSRAESAVFSRFRDDQFAEADRSLCLYNVYSHEKLDVTYCREGIYVPDALEEINYMMRDSRTGKVKKMNTHLIDLLFMIRSSLKSTEPYQIISGYRTPGSNAYLRKRKKGVSRNSLHMYGKAVDLRLPGCRLKDLRRTAMSFKAGGVGYYPRSNFVHIDVGSVRYWWG